jgi:NADPH:quinone reductase-like Zn-dependent oxidoreductase
LVERVQRGELRAMVDRTYSLADSCAAFRSLMAGEACGKLVVEVE